MAKNGTKKVTVKMEAGMISPKKRTAVTEMMMAAQDGTSWSRASGRASQKRALQRSRVTRRRWWGMWTTSGSSLRA